MIFARFMAIYGHKFKSCFESDAEIRIAKREWALSLRGYGEAELVAAIDHCKEQLAWMPTVSEFLAILREQQGNFGLPSPHRAYEEACRFALEPTRHQWSHAAVYQAGRETGWFELRSEPEERMFKAFSYNYEICCRRVRNGEQLDQPVQKGLPDQQDNTRIERMQAWAEAAGLEMDEASKLLYYMTKPKGSRTRARFRKQAQQQCLEKGIREPLPE
ncbi:hypothetical protein K6T12_08645 [Marinobacterium sp. CAU 1594]|nr:hypothetical protein [Marinobacterium arenosum]